MGRQPRRASSALPELRSYRPEVAEPADFDDFWEPFAYGVGPAGQSFVALPEQAKARVREFCREALPQGAFTLDAHAWYARGTVPPT